MMKGNSKIKIVLADDHRIMREGLRSLLERQPNLEIVAETDNGRDALKLCEKLIPEIIIMDITMPDLNGIEATRQIVAECPGVGVIGLSVHSDRQFVDAMLKAGASAYLLKDCTIHEVLSAIQSVLKKQTYLSPGIATHVLNGYLRGSRDTVPGPRSLLTPRETEVLQLFAEGKTRKSVADLLNISPRTVETHRRRLMDKLGIETTADLIKFAIREGFTQLEP
jgi:DNA-binding NarL/FixJ family response regulator